MNEFLDVNWKVVYDALSAPIVEAYSTGRVQRHKRGFSCGSLRGSVSRETAVSGTITVSEASV
jgi:hypothetical protein